MGTLEVICGPMFSGKTEELIRRLKRAAIAKRKVQVFKPGIDNRYDPDTVASHSRQKMVSTVIHKAGEVLARLQPDVEVVGIDEVQFLGPEIVPIVKQLADTGLRGVGVPRPGEVSDGEAPGRQGPAGGGGGPRPGLPRRAVRADAAAPRRGG